jgi:beta-N-acetylhexosaminidase
MITVGGVILFSRNFLSLEQLEELVRDIHSVRSPPLLVAVDHEGGRVQRFGDPFYKLPPMRLLGHLYDRDSAAAERTAAAFGWMVGAELRAVGIDLGFVPVVDLDLGLAEVIGDRALHASAEVVSRLALKFMDGAERAGMASTAKHFPTHSGAAADSHTERAVDRRDYADLAEDLLPYRRLIAAGLHSIMVGHVVFPELDEHPASLSSWWITTQLRHELGFTGAVISDDMSMTGADDGRSVPSRILKALEAGCDLVLLCNQPEAVPAVLASLERFNSPASQLRLMRLRPREPTPGWRKLHEGRPWNEARQLLDALSATPPLELQG